MANSPFTPFKNAVVPHAEDPRVGMYERQEDLVRHFPTASFLGAVLNDEYFIQSEPWSLDNDGITGLRATFGTRGIRLKDGAQPSQRAYDLLYRVNDFMRALTGQKMVHMQVNAPGMETTPHYDAGGGQEFRVNLVLPLNTGDQDQTKGTGWVLDADVTREQILLMRDNPMIKPQNLGLRVAHAPSDRPFILRRGLSHGVARSQLVDPRDDALLHFAAGHRYALVVT